MLAGRTYLKLVGAVIVRPRLWVIALRQARRLVPRNWWSTGNHLPLPTREYIDFRMTTQYGDASHQPDIADIIDYLEWSKDWHSTGTSTSRRLRKI
jgi:hypothetical protein